MEPPVPQTPSELKRIVEAGRQGAPFLAYRDDGDALRVEPLGGRASVTIGRSTDNDLALVWDGAASRVHAQLERLADAWTLVDDGLSRNGSYVNGERVLGRCRLADGDVVRLGHTAFAFHAPPRAMESTSAAEPAALVRLTPAEHRVLAALCRPVVVPGGSGMPATNREIAEQLHLTIPGVKTHIRSLFTKLGVDALPQYSKRAELAKRAIGAGLVRPRDLEG